MVRNEAGDAFRNSNRYRDHEADKKYGDNCGKCGAKRIDSQLGLEKTPEEYVAKMVEIFREVRRVLRKDGTCWVNLGDSYATRLGGDGWDDYEWKTGGKVAPAEGTVSSIKRTREDIGLKPKDLVGVPWRVAFALQADGWYLRSDIIWSKPNPMPESVTDRPTKAHEYLFLLTKSPRYFYDAEAIKEASQASEESLERAAYGRYELSNGKAKRNYRTGKPDYLQASGNDYGGGSRNKRSVWTVATAPYPEAHFATYPPDLIKPCIMAGTSAKGCCARCGAPWERIVERGNLIADRKSVEIWKPIKRDDSHSAWSRPGGKVETVAPNCHYENKTLGWRMGCHCHAMNSTTTDNKLYCGAPVPCTVLDPFAGSGTTGAVALELGRKAILIELNPKYVELIRQRCDVTLGLALA
jgi:DNA modification methylase